uniref:Reverse transcriptase domain-containing protein n=1 Tax=Fagus sylvatica TaxID=28930 RepID=A0A2N9HBE7_FAGSY
MGEGCRSPFSLIRTPESMEAHEHLVEGVFDPISDHERRPDGGESPHRDRNQQGLEKKKGAKLGGKVPNDIVEIITQFYINLYTEEVDWRPKLDGLEFSMISEEDAIWLERSFEQDEVEGVLKHFNGDKAPRPNGFPMSQQIWDSVLNSNEVLDSWLKQGTPGVMCKVDIEKAYDHVYWGFLIYLLHQSGFLMKWCNWIWFCISTIRFSVIINGYPQGFFASSRGLRQGDPLSPLLFDVLMESLSRLMVHAANGGYISGFLVGVPGGNSLMLSHLLFADDTLLFCNNDLVQLEYLRHVFTWFEVVSGLRVNLHKSEMVPVGDVPNLEELVAVLSCKLSARPMTYLGIPLGTKFNFKTIWNPVIEKMERRLAGWKCLYLSKGGKLTLIKSTLSNLPTYFLSLFCIPSEVANHLEKLQRDFLWNGMGEQPKFHLVKWATVCEPIHNGNLGVKNLRFFNQSLLGKWLWRYRMDGEALWRKVVEVKYGIIWGGWCSKEICGTHGVGLWKGIRRGWEMFHSFLSFSVDKEAIVADFLLTRTVNLHWEVAFVRNLQDWEIDALTSFLDLLYSVSLHDSGLDQLF